MNNIIEKFESKFGKDRVILAVLVVTESLDIQKIPLNSGELLLLDIPPVVPYYLTLVNLALAHMAIEKFSGKAKVDSRFFQLVNKTEENKNQFGMLVLTDDCDMEKSLVKEIQGEYAWFLKKLGGEDFLRESIPSLNGKNQANNFLKRFGSKKITIPFYTVLGKDEQPILFSGKFSKKPYERDKEEGDLVLEGKIDCPSFKKKTFNILGEKNRSGIHFELKTFFNDLAFHNWQRSFIRFSISHWKRDGKDKLTLKGLKVLEEPQQVLDFSASGENC